MPTIRQVEALYWIQKLGSFERAARQLNTTQSAISKRIQELELDASQPLFDRAQRKARLTPHGLALVALAEEMLRVHDRLADLMTTKESRPIRLALGVTELTAMTWLPRLLETIRNEYPHIELRTEVESSQGLVERLVDHHCDFIIVPDAFDMRGTERVAIGKVEFSWMCSSGLDVPERARLTDLARWPILVQDDRSGSGRIFGEWMAERGLVPENYMTSNNLVALIGMVTAGLGVTCMPPGLVRPLLRRRQLRIIDTRPSLPAIPYVMMYRRREPLSHDALLACVRRSCNFNTAVYDPGRT